MTLLKAIARADMLRPNAIDNDIKAEWIYTLEAEIAELMDVDIPENPYPKDSEEDLLMPKPYDDIYYLYLMAKIDLAMEDTESYANDQMVANNAILDAKGWWRRHHKKQGNNKIRAFSWQPKIKGEEDVTEPSDPETEETDTDITD